MSEEVNQCCPKYVSDVSDGYIQNIRQQSFKGKSEEVHFAADKSAVVVLCNPKNSGVTVNLNKVYHVNMSATPMRNDVYYYPEIKGDLCKSRNIVNGNTKGSKNIKSKAQLYYGEGVEMSGGISPYTFAINQYSTFVGTSAGANILYPGMSVAFFINSINCNQCGSAFICISWWEEEIPCESCSSESSSSDCYCK